MSTSTTLRAAILVVSTTAAKGTSTDTTGPILQDLFVRDGSGKWDVVETLIVCDDIPSIQRAVIGWTDRSESINVIITTGGTGFAVNDVTPEVCFPHDVDDILY